MEKSKFGFCHKFIINFYEIISTLKLMMKFRLQRCHNLCCGVRSNSLIGPGDIVAFRANAQLKHFENAKSYEKTKLLVFFSFAPNFKLFFSKIYPLC
jgi:hypothetical protein